MLIKVACKPIPATMAKYEHAGSKLGANGPWKLPALSTANPVRL